MSKALLLIDIQNDYFPNGANALAGSDQAGANARLVLDRFRTLNLPVVHIQHLANRQGATFFVPGTDGAEIHASVKPLANEKLVVKHFPNSFRDTDLEAHLKSLKISDLIVCGMMTHMCVDATVRAAKDLGYNLTVIGDACATKDLEIDGRQVSAIDVHHSFLAALNYFYASVKPTQLFLSEKS